MSARGLETVLARLYTDPDFRIRFLQAPESALEEQELSAGEKDDLLAIDRAGLVMAARSYQIKRQGRLKGSYNAFSRWAQKALASGLRRRPT